MKLAISNIAWELENSDKVYKLMIKNNFIGLEIAPTKFFPENPYLIKFETLKTLKSFFEKNKLELVSMQSILFGKSELVLFEDNDKREKLLSYLKEGVLFAKNLGIKNMVFGNPKNRISTSKKDWEVGLNFFRKLGEFAFENNVTIGIEANPVIYGGNFLTTTEEAIKFVLECNSVGVGLNLDLGTIIQNNEKLEILNTIPIGKISHVHISEPYLNLISKENESLHKELFKYLKKEKYNNYISIEMKYIEENNLQNIEKCLKYIKKLDIEVENE